MSTQDSRVGTGTGPLETLPPRTQKQGRGAGPDLCLWLVLRAGLPCPGHGSVWRGPMPRGPGGRGHGGGGRWGRGPCYRLSRQSRLFMWLTPPLRLSTRTSVPSSVALGLHGPGLRTPPHRTQTGVWRRQGQMGPTTQTSLVGSEVRTSHFREASVPSGGRGGGGAAWGRPNEWGGDGDGPLRTIIETCVIRGLFTTTREHVGTSSTYKWFRWGRGFTSVTGGTVAPAGSSRPTCGGRFPLLVEKTGGCYAVREFCVKRETNFTASG